MAHLGTIFSPGLVTKPTHSLLKEANIEVVGLSAKTASEYIETVVHGLNQIKDRDFPNYSLVEMGLIRTIKIGTTSKDNLRLEIGVTFTQPSCPNAQVIGTSVSAVITAFLNQIANENGVVKDPTKFSGRAFIEPVFWDPSKHASGNYLNMLKDLIELAPDTFHSMARQANWDEAALKKKIMSK